MNLHIFFYDQNKDMHTYLRMEVRVVLGKFWPMKKYFKNLITEI